MVFSIRFPAPKYDIDQDEESRKQPDPAGKSQDSDAENEQKTKDPVRMPAFSGVKTIRLDCMTGFGRFTADGDAQDSPDR